jgi:hypothetical protein
MSNEKTQNYEVVGNFMGFFIDIKGIKLQA